MIKKFTIITSLGCILSNASSMLGCIGDLAYQLCRINIQPVTNSRPLEQDIGNVREPHEEAQRGSEVNMRAQPQESTAIAQEEHIAAAIAESLRSAEAEANERASLAFIENEEIERAQRDSAAIEQERTDAAYAAQVQLDLGTENPQQQEPEPEVYLEEPEVEPEQEPGAETEQQIDLQRAAQESLAPARQEEEEELRQAKEESDRTAEQDHALRLENSIFDRQEFLESIDDMRTFKKIITIRVKQMLYFHSQGNIAGISSLLQIQRALLEKIQRIESIDEFSTLNSSIGNLMALIGNRPDKLDLIKKRIEEFGQAAHAVLDAVIEIRR